MSICCFWSNGKILFLAEVIAGQRSALMCINVIIVIVLCERFSMQSRVLKIESKFLSSTFFEQLP